MSDTQADLAPRAESDDAAKRDRVAATIAVLRLLAQLDRPAGVNAIARELQLAPSSCFKILRSLCAEDCVEFDAKTKEYSLGFGAIMFARSALDPACAFTTVRSNLEAAAEDTKTAIGMWRVLPANRMALIGFVEGPGDLRINLRIGQRLPMYLGALGRAIAAARDDDPVGLRRLFDELRWEAPLSFETYYEQVIEARNSRYAVDGGNFAPGITTIAAAISDEMGVARYGVSAIVLSHRADQPRIERIGRRVAQAAEWAQRRLFGGFPPRSI